MEVHAHTHTPRKKWTHYFWEFLMLFLAVFCGFLAENWREHYIEHKRSQGLSISLKKDLTRDTTVLRGIIYNRNERTEIFNKLLDEIEKPQNLRNDTLIAALAEDELY